MESRKSAIEFKNAQDNFRALRILCWALIIGVFICAGTTVALHPFFKSDKISPEIAQGFVIAGAVISLICLLIARNVYMKGMHLVKNLTGSLNDQLNHYRSFMIRYWALCEGPGILAGMLFLVTGNYWLLVIVGISIVAMIITVPTRKGLIEKLELDWTKQAELS